MARCLQSSSSNTWFLLPLHVSIRQKAKTGDPGAPHVPAKPAGLTPRCYKDKELRTQIKISPCLSTSLHAAGVALLQTSPEGAVPRAGLEQDAPQAVPVGGAEQRRPRPSCSSREQDLAQGVQGRSWTCPGVSLYPAACRQGSGRGFFFLPRQSGANNS